MTSMESWHVEKKITFGNLLTSLISITAIIVWVFTLQGRVSITEVRLDQLHSLDSDRSNEVKTLGDTIIRQLDTIEASQRSIQDKQYDHLKDHQNSANQNTGH